MIRLTFVFLLLFSLNTTADDNSVIEKFSVLGHRENLPTQPGSAHLIDEGEMKKFGFSDIHRLLQAVPGVNLQEEEGFGLRPNIGLRGAHPHRSKKITIMEDGVLIGPAPYSAPAAYYFPQIEKMSGIEVFKGSSSLRYGPQSIGGAINMVTRVQPHGARLQAEYGSFNLQKYQAGIGIESYGDFSLMLNRASHDGFKQLPSGGNTGFERNNILFRWDKFYSPYDQNLTLKLNWANEDSRSSYLGLAKDDFVANPRQRYAASEKDQMNWEHKQFFINYSLEPIQDWRLRLTTYRHEFARAWNKFDGFFDQDIDVRDALNQPSLAYFYEVIRGTQDSSLAGNRDSIRLTNNQRAYESQGLQVHNTFNSEGEDWSNEISISYRLHQDQVERDHVSAFYDMRQGKLVANSLADETLTRNLGQATAHTMTIYNQTQWDHLTFSTGARVENISYRQTELSSSQVVESSDQVFVPGAGMFYEFFTGGGVLAGVHQGVTPVGPGQGANINPEEATNYELGFRYSGTWGIEVIGFYSDYQNILGTCTQSSGCASSQLDRQFNGGQAEVYGVESLANFEPRWKALSFPIRIGATFTQARFANSFTSTLEDWGLGDIESGDPIPYIPLLQGNASFGVLFKKWKSFVNFQYTSSVVDQAVSLGRDEVPSRLVIDYSLQYQVLDNTSAYFRVNNLTGQNYAVSYRPFGLRPGRPQTFFVGLNYAL